ncbi:MAG TPA: CHAD domain-containing protein [Terriglobales bacterium]|nr:CHAD domain-containing protein [Terriglobales bacterium]
MALNPDNLQKPLRKLRKMLKAFPRNPSLEMVHNLRTRTRRIEAMLRALRLDTKRNEQKLLKEVKPIRRRAGKVRDMDVLTGLATKLQPDGEAECLVALLEHLGTERDQLSRKLSTQVRQGGPSIRGRLKRSARSIGKVFDQAKKPGNGSGQSSEWSADAAVLALELSGELAQWPRLDARNLHPYRLKVKKLRYVLQLAENADAGFVKILGEVKDTIGEWHDWQELGRIAEQVLDHGPGCEVLKLVRSIAKAKFNHGLLLANRMRQEYLEEPDDKRHRRAQRTMSAHLKPAVISATSALVA